LSLASLCGADRRDLGFHRGGKFTDADFDFLRLHSCRQGQLRFPPLAVEPLVIVTDILGDAFADDDGARFGHARTDHAK
jgi:hypothetical protein